MKSAYFFPSAEKTAPKPRARKPKPALAKRAPSSSSDSDRSGCSKDFFLFMHHLLNTAIRIPRYTPACCKRDHRGGCFVFCFFYSDSEPDTISEWKKRDEERRRELEERRKKEEAEELRRLREREKEEEEKKKKDKVKKRSDSSSSSDEGVDDHPLKKSKKPPPPPIPAPSDSDSSPSEVQLLKTCWPPKLKKYISAVTFCFIQSNRNACDSGCC